MSTNANLMELTTVTCTPDASIPLVHSTVHVVKDIQETVFHVMVWLFNEETNMFQSAV